MSIWCEMGEFGASQLICETKWRIGAVSGDRIRKSYYNALRLINPQAQLGDCFTVLIGHCVGGLWSGG